MRDNTIKKIRIRRALEKEIPKMQKVIYSSIKSTKINKRLMNKLYRDYTIENIKKAKKRTEMFVAEKNKEIVGTGRLEKTHEIRMIYVEPEMQRKGVGTKMMKHLEKLAKKRKWKTIHVKALWPAKNFYKNLGFYHDKKNKNKETCFMRKKLK